MSVSVQASAGTAAQNRQRQAAKKTPTRHSSASPVTSKHSKSASKHRITHTSAAHASTKRSSTKGKRARGKSRRTAKKRGQQVIDSDRARQIQEALIREHYLDGEPTGKWDAATQAAMQRYQADQGWQTKTTPDSRALIKLGLGPSPEHLLNPESAMTSATASISKSTDASDKASAKSKAADVPPSPSEPTPVGDPPQK